MTTKEDILAKVKDVLRNELFFEEEIEPDTLVRDLGLDSIQLMQLFVYLEESFDFEFAYDSVFENLRGASVNEFVDVIYNSINRQQQEVNN